ncbi:MAG: hypothetical protein ABI481_06795 [Pyrinomonadaceae bacterium]
MKQSYSSALVSLVILLAIGLACNKFKSADAGPVGNTTAAAPASPKPQDIVGNYEIKGTNENGAGGYSGTLAVTERGDVYQFSWDTAGKKYDGVGVRAGNAVGVAFASGDNGDGCGVVLYKIGSDGTLDGKAGYWGNNSSEAETAKRTKGDRLEGEYDVSGKNTAGQPYTGKLGVKQSGVGYTFSWNAGSPMEGFGIRQGDAVAVGIGGGKCGFVSYELKPDGTLDGKWGGSGSKSVGSEVAKKK